MLKKRSKLFQILHIFNAKELKEFSNFLNSPYHNTDPKCCDLLLLLKKENPNFLDEKFDKKIVHRKIYADQIYEESTITSLLSRLYKKAKEFLAIEQVKKNTTLQRKLLITALAEHPAHDIFQRESDELQAQLKKTAARETNSFLDIYLLEEQMYFHPDTDKKKADVQLLQTTTEHLDQFYALSKLKLTCEAYNRKDIYVDQHRPILLEAIEEATASHFGSIHPIFDLYYRTLKLFKGEENLSVFKLLLDDLKKQLHHIDKSDARNILQFSLNYAFKQHQQKKEGYDELILPIYEWGLDHEILTEKGRITPTTFINVVCIGCQLEKSEWVEAFMAKYENLLEHSVKKTR